MPIFISFEGLDGSGKTTQAHMLQDALAKKGEKAYLVHEPSGTFIGKRVQEIAQENKTQPINDHAFACLFMADRIVHYESIIQKKLEHSHVLSDRYLDSTFAYQGANLKRSLEQTGVAQPLQKALESLAAWIDPLAERSLQKPAITFLLVLHPNDALARTKRRSELQRQELSNFEKKGLGYFQDVAAAYHWLENKEPERFVRIDGSLQAEEIHQKILSCLQALFPAEFPPN